MQYNTQDVEDLAACLRAMVDDYKDKKFAGKDAVLYAYAILGWVNTIK